jgi:hypothetical protein
MQSSCGDIQVYVSGRKNNKILPILKKMQGISASAESKGKK